MKKKKVFIACDNSNLKVVKKIITNTKTNKLDVGYKFGIEFFYSKYGRNFILKSNNKKIFIDLKLNDIPNTCASAIYSLKDLKNISYITVHINGGFEMLRAVKKASNKTNKNLKVLGVTVLTSFSNKSLRKTGHTKLIKDIIRKQAFLAKEAKLDGIVCSGNEARFVKKICKNMEIITPGIRFKGDKGDDQKRVTSPQEAFNNGASAIVMGRSITRGNIKKNIQKLIKSLN